MDHHAKALPFRSFAASLPFGPRRFRPWVASAILSSILVFCTPPAFSQLDLGPEEVLQAGGSSIAVPGYSVPSFSLWNGDSLPDLIVGQGDGSSPGKVRVYLNSGTNGSPVFQGYSFAQSSGADLSLPGVS